MATDLQENFHIFFDSIEKSIFLKYKISTHKVISAIPLLRLERGSSGILFAYIVCMVYYILYVPKWPKNQTSIFLKIQNLDSQNYFSYPNLDNSGPVLCAISYMLPNGH